MRNRVPGLLIALPLGVPVVIWIVHVGVEESMPLIFVVALVTFAASLVTNLFRSHLGGRSHLSQRLASTDFVQIAGRPPIVLLVAAVVLGVSALALFALALALFAEGNPVVGSIPLFFALALQLSAQRRLSDYMLWINAWKASRLESRTGLRREAPLNLGRRQRRSVL
jgi:hypothetical protein